MQINSAWQDAFRQDLARNMRRVSNNFTKQLFIKDIALECVWYSCDMCLHYYHQGAYQGISQDIIENIAYNVCYAMNSLVKEFRSNCWGDVIDKVKILMTNPNTFDVLQQEVDKYYQR